MMVKFKHPQNAAEQSERFYVVETRGDRVLVSPVDCIMALVPTFVYPAEDMEPTR